MAKTASSLNLKINCGYQKVLFNKFRRNKTQTELSGLKLYAHLQSVVTCTRLDAEICTLRQPQITFCRHDENNPSTGLTGAIRGAGDLPLATLPTCSCAAVIPQALPMFWRITTCSIHKNRAICCSEHRDCHILRSFRLTRLQAVCP